MYNAPNTVYWKAADRLLDFGTRIIEREYGNVESDETPRDSSVLDDSATGNSGTGNSNECQSLYRRGPDGSFLFASAPRRPLPDGRPEDAELRRFVATPGQRVPSSTLGQCVSAKERDPHERHATGRKLKL